MLKCLRLGFFFLLAVPWMVGCVSTRTRYTSRVNPELSGADFSTVMMHGNFRNLEYRVSAEQRFCKEITRRTRSRCIQSVDIFFPGEEHTPEEIKEKLEKLGVDCVLTLQEIEKGKTSSYVPPISSTQTTGSVVGNSFTAQSFTTTVGGGTVRSPWANYEVLLYSMKNGRVAWYATAMSRGNGYAHWDDLIESASKYAVRQLLEDGLLQPKEKRRKRWMKFRRNHG